MSDSPALNNTFLEAAIATISNVEGNLASCENNPFTLVGISPDRDDRRIFWGLKLSFSGVWFGKFCQVFFGG